MPLIEEIENVLPFVAELPIDLQQSIARWVSRVVVAEEERDTMTREQRARLRELDDDKVRRQLRGR